MKRFITLTIITALTVGSVMADERPRARDLGIAPGVLPTGELNAITDVDGVRVGHVSLVSGDDIRTGVTAVLPHDGNVFQDKVPAAVHTANGFGKAVGFEQVRELGTLESPVLLTNTLNVGTVMDAGARWVLEQEGNEDVRSVNVLVGETNDGYLNDIRAQYVRPQHVFSAIESAEGGLVAEGNVGAGTGTRAFGWKAGIGTASRTLPATLGGHTVGVLVQANFGGILTMDGVRVGEILGQYRFRDVLETGLELELETEQGSIMVVIATDAPVGERNLERMAKRAALGIGRTGGFMSNGSGDFMVAFSTAERVRHGADRSERTISRLNDSAMDPLFLATVEATEEAIYNSLVQAESMSGRDGRHLDAIPLERLEELFQ
ncbi:DmpA family aminopeptidase [Natronospira bacteriovora]|uniref:P1 family peptidase n=1 Tax=Natronospira bacteriovora TaxID=3069753 RepID=A0ABU0W7G9_9GAMM|nr:P1 family peptidase [Natronospira sp. AB-CW4]MDQ2069980.1 P1 family peptidase [Natronospira sp. AB-CW4]